MNVIQEESQSEYAKMSSYIGSETFLPQDHSRKGRSLSAENRRKKIM